MAINDLVKDNEILKAEVREQKLQIFKLQEIIDSKLKEEDENVVSDLRISKFQSRETDPKLFQKYIEEAIKKL